MTTACQDWAVFIISSQKENEASTMIKNKIAKTEYFFSVPPPPPNPRACHLSAFETNMKLECVIRGMCLLLQENCFDDRNGDTFNSHVIVMV